MNDSRLPLGDKLYGYHLAISLAYTTYMQDVRTSDNPEKILERFLREVEDIEHNVFLVTRGHTIFIPGQITRLRE
jgi:hypothetical protein